MFTVQFLSLVVQIFFSQMLYIQKSLNNFIHGAIYERKSQVTQGVVRQSLLERASSGKGSDYVKIEYNNNESDLMQKQMEIGFTRMTS